MQASAHSAGGQPGLNKTLSQNINNKWWYSEIFYPVSICMRLDNLCHVHDLWVSSYYNLNDGAPSQTHVGIWWSIQQYEKALAIKFWGLCCQEEISFLIKVLGLNLVKLLFWCRIQHVSPLQPGLNKTMKLHLESRVCSLTRHWNCQNC